MKVDGIRALVTGGARSIGKALVERLLTKGAKFVAIVDINHELGTATCKEFKEKYGDDKVQFIHCNVTVQKDLEKAFEEAASTYSGLDVVVNNAGVVDKTKVIAVNLEGVMRGCELAKKYMSKTNGGSGGVVINTASICGFMPLMDPYYCASKHGVIGFTRTSAEYDPVFTADDIRIAAICPTFVNTDLLAGVSEDIKRTLNFVPISQVVDAFIMGIEDESKHGCCIRVTAGLGIDLLPTKTSKEWIDELQILKS